MDKHLSRIDRKQKMRYIYFTIWALLVFYILFVILQPIGVEAQGVYAIFALSIMAVIHILGLKGVARNVLLAIGCTVAFRYLYWRATSTLPEVDDLANFIPGILLLVAEFYAIGMLFLSAFISAEPLRRKPVPLTGDPKDYPSVDVFVPSYNENDDIVGNTLAAARNLRYPKDKLNIYLLDDGGTEEKCTSDDDEIRNDALARKARLQKFCKNMGVNYLARDKNEKAKAGNLNYGLEHSSGEFVLVLDADHAPVADFLVKTMGYMQQNEELYLVQTPHFFSNVDPVEHNLGVANNMPSENEMFYSVTQKGFEKWNASFFCGSAAVLRRAALDEVGGFKGETVTEDCETALELHARGWSSTYVDEPMIAGFQPETVSAFLTQRSRWCQGMIQILLLNSPLWKRGLSFMQRVSYLSSMLFWLFPFSRLVFIYSPALFVFFDFQFYNATAEELLVYTVVYMFTSSIMQNYMYGSVRWPLMSETYEYIQSLTLMRVIFSTLLNPRKPQFKVTDKGVELKQNFFSSHGWLFLVSHIFLIATFAYSFYRVYFEGDTNATMIMVTFWCFFNMVLSGLALGICAEKRREYRYYRMQPTIDERQCLVELNNKRFYSEIVDISINGIRLKFDNPPEGDLLGSDAKVWINHPKLGSEPVDFELLVNRDFTSEKEPSIGAHFVNVGVTERRAISTLMLDRNTMISSKRKYRLRHRSIIFGIVYVIWWSAKQTARGFIYAAAHIFRRGEKHNTNMKPSTPITEVA